MPLRKIILCITACLCFLSVHAQGIRGKVTTTEGNPIAYTSVFIPDLKKGTTANEEGNFQLALPKGNYELHIQYLGYQTLKYAVTIDKDWVSLDIQLVQQPITLSEVIITASGEDPAYYFMRKAIGMSQYYKNQIASYTANVYIKGSGVPLKIPPLLRKQFKKEGIEESKLYISETISDISYERGSPLSSTVTSLRSAGFGDESIPMEFVTISLYDNIAGTISPFSRDAFGVYKFKLLGSFIEDGAMIHKIAVIPKRKGNDLYKGILYVRENSWSIHSVELQVEQKQFTALINQVYAAIEPFVWMPVSYDFKLDLSFMGVKAEFKYLARIDYNDIVLNPAINHSIYTDKMGVDEELLLLNGANIDTGKSPVIHQKLSSKDEKKLSVLLEKDDLTNRESRQMNRLVQKTIGINKKDAPLEIKMHDTRVEDSAALRNKEYWEQNRAVPLTIEEQASFDQEEVKTQPKDSLSNATSGLQAFLFGFHKKKISDKNLLTYHGLLNPLLANFNTVDGIVYRQRIALEHELSNAAYWNILADIGYAFSRKSLLAQVRTDLLIDPIRRTKFSVEAGQLSRDFNKEGGMSPLVNIATTLLFNGNFLKLYEDRFVHFAFETDLANGLNFSGKAAFKRVKQLDNAIEGYIFNKNSDLTPNIPPSFANQPQFFEDHNTFAVDLAISWTPRYYYRINKGRKEMLRSAYPTFEMKWTQAIPGLLRANSDFSHAQFSMQQTLRSNRRGNLFYRLNAGAFFDVKKIYFEDFKFLHSYPLLIDASAPATSFFGLDYYERASSNAYFSTFVSYNHARILIKRIPKLSESLIRESLFARMHISPSHHPYFEFGYGLNQVFLLFDFSVFGGFEDGKMRSVGLRIGLPLQGSVIAF